MHYVDAYIYVWSICREDRQGQKLQGGKEETRRQRFTRTPLETVMYYCTCVSMDLQLGGFFFLCPKRQKQKLLVARLSACHGCVCTQHQLSADLRPAPSQSDVKSVENLRYLLACCLKISFLLPPMHPAGILAKALKFRFCCHNCPFV